LSIIVLFSGFDSSFIIMVEQDATFHMQDKEMSEEEKEDEEQEESENEQHQQQEQQQQQPEQDLGGV
jgi:hypothetical protein